MTLSAAFGMPKLRVFVVCDFGDVTGGAAKVAIDSAVALAEAGVNVSYVYVVPPLSGALSHPNITCHILEGQSVWQQRNPLKAALLGIWNDAARRGLNAIVSQYAAEPCIIHLHQWSKAFSPSVLMVAQRFPMVVSLHDYFISCPNGAYYHFPVGRPCTMKPMSAGCVVANCDSRGRAFKAVRLVRQIATDFAKKKVGTSLNFLSVSPSAERVIEKFLSPTSRRFVVRSPTDAAKGAPSRITEASPIIYIGRLTEEKGIRLLVEAARAVSMPLTLVGDGPLFDEIDAIGGLIRCTGWLSREKVAAELATARVLVFPSRWYETGGLVVLEALARGVPALVSRITAAADFIVEGENGFLIDPNDRAALIECLQQLRDTRTASRMGQNAYQRYWAAPFTSARHSADLIRVYRSILDGLSGASASIQV